MSAFQRLYGWRDQFRGLMFLEPVDRNLTILDIVNNCQSIEVWRR